MRKIILTLAALSLLALPAAAQAAGSTSFNLHLLGDPDTTLSVAPGVKDGKPAYTFTLASSNQEVLDTYLHGHVRLTCDYTTEPPSSQMTSSGSLQIDAVWTTPTQILGSYNAYGYLLEDGQLSPLSAIGCQLHGPYGGPVLDFIDSEPGSIEDLKLAEDKLFDGSFRQNLAFKLSVHARSNSPDYENFLCENTDRELLAGGGYGDLGCIDRSVTSMQDVQNRGIVYRVGKPTPYSARIAYMVGKSKVSYTAALWDFGVASTLIERTLKTSPSQWRRQLPISAQAAVRSLNKMIRDADGNAMEKVYSVGVLSRHNRPHAYRGRHVGLWVAMSGRGANRRLQVWGRYGRSAAADWTITSHGEGSGNIDWPTQLDWSATQSYE